MASITTTTTGSASRRTGWVDLFTIPAPRQRCEHATASGTRCKRDGFNQCGIISCSSHAERALAAWRSRRFYGDAEREAMFREYRAAVVAPYGGA